LTIDFADIAPGAPFSMRVPAIDEQVVVLGRSQQAEVTGLPAVRRLSGGGAVLLTPGDVLWVDVVVPRGHMHWDDDVGRATWWLGEVWAAALGVDGAEVHRGGVVRCTPWCKAVCFGGLGPGEVHVDQRKLVGIAQRRTRAGALFQCAVNLRWDPAPLVRALGLPDGAVGELQDAVLTVAGPATAIVDRLRALLPGIALGVALEGLDPPP
jgi:lipoate-protein ligase A